MLNLNLVSNKIKQFIKIILFRVIHAQLRKFPRFGSNKNIVLLCDSAQMVEHLADFWNVFKDEKYLNFVVFQTNKKKIPITEKLFSKPHKKGQDGESERLLSLLPIRKIDTLELNLRRWDLVILADHLFNGNSLSGLDALQFWPTLRIMHGIPNKVHDGEHYTFGSGCFYIDGKVRYTNIQVTSDADKELAIEINPKLSEKVIVVGNLRSDALLEKLLNRDKIRNDLGIGKEEKLVFIVSTWGPHCLFNTMGNVILAEALKLMGQFHFALSIHPLEHSLQIKNSTNWESYLSSLQKEGFFILKPGDNWDKFIVACDIILTDHTSLSLYGAAMYKPYIYVPVPENLIQKNGLTWQLMQISPCLNLDASNLLACINFVLNEYPYKKLKVINERFYSYPGEAKIRTRKAVYDMLNK